MIRVWFEKESWLGRAFIRITNAYKEFAPPEIEFTNQEDADLYMVHYLGPGQEKYYEKPFVLIVHDKPWRSFIQTAAMVSTFHPIDNALILPWGVDPCFEWPEAPVEKKWQCMATGYVSTTEWIKDAYYATVEFDQLPFLHIGGDIGLDDCIMYTRKENISDTEMVRSYQEAKFINCVRKPGGFEMPAIEGLVCGARPICIVMDGYYRQWFGDHAVYLPDQDAYLSAFQNYVPVTKEESDEIREKFAWKGLVEQFWAEVLKVEL